MSHSELQASLDANVAAAVKQVSAKVVDVFESQQVIGVSVQLFMVLANLCELLPRDA